MEKLANIHRMSLEEAINHATVKAEEQEREARVVTSKVTRDYCLQCAVDHRQLAAWLTELKNRREGKSSGDSISRQDAINSIENTDVELSAKDWDELTNAIKLLPSAEPCNKDAISREGLLKSWEELSPRGRTEFDQVIMTMPALPPADRPTGEWVEVVKDGVLSCTDAYAMCDQCHKVKFNGWGMNFCPNCGARMRGEETPNVTIWRYECGAKVEGAE